jgi:hypothetical protein
MPPVESNQDARAISTLGVSHASLFCAGCYTFSIIRSFLPAMPSVSHPWICSDKTPTFCFLFPRVAPHRALHDTTDNTRHQTPPRFTLVPYALIINSRTLVNGTVRGHGQPCPDSSYSTYVLHIVRIYYHTFHIYAQNIF